MEDANVGAAAASAATQPAPTTTANPVKDSTCSGSGNNNNSNSSSNNNHSHSHSSGGSNRGRPRGGRNKARPKEESKFQLSVTLGRGDCGPGESMRALRSKRGGFGHHRAALPIAPREVPASGSADAPVPSGLDSVPVADTATGGDSHSDSRPPRYTGKLGDNCVYVQDSEDMRWLFQQGFFGKGALSKSEPEYHKLLADYELGRKDRVTAKERQMSRKKDREDEKDRKRRRNDEAGGDDDAIGGKMIGNRASMLLDDSICEADALAAAGVSEIAKEQSLDSAASATGAAADTVETAETDAGWSLKSALPTTDLVSDSTSQESKGKGKDRSNNQGSPISIGNSRSKDRNKVGKNESTTDQRSSGSKPSKSNKNSNDINNDHSSRATTGLCAADDDALLNPHALDSDSDNDGGADPRARPGFMPMHVTEHLQLTLEEAFFLAYGLGCLDVLDEHERTMGLQELWQCCRRAQPNFLANYVVYHHLRSRGWVPKSGLKFGSEFVAYRKGPAFFHASFQYTVMMVNEETLEPWEEQSEHRRHLTWSLLSNLNRLSAQVAKELVMCYVLRPGSLSDDRLDDPRVVSLFKVQQVLVRRWIPDRARDP